jgi:Tfp pilus assembly protein PilN
VRQQINLYQPMFRKQKKVFSAVAMLQVWVFTLAVLGAVYAYTGSRIEPFEVELGKIETQRQKLQNQIAQLEKTAPSQKQSKLLAAEIDRLSRELERKREIHEVISKSKIGSEAGFSAIFEALARRHLDGTWLTSVAIRNGGEYLGFSGRTVSAELVPQYLQRLAEERAFSGRVFNVLELRRPEDGGGILAFDVSTAQAVKGK